MMIINVFQATRNRTRQQKGEEEEERKLHTHTYTFKKLVERDTRAHYE